MSHTVTADRRWCDIGVCGTGNGLKITTKASKASDAESAQPVILIKWYAGTSTLAKCKTHQNDGAENAV